MFLLALPPIEDRLQFRQKVIPFCEAALSDTMQLPPDVYNMPLDVNRTIDIGEHFLSVSKNYSLAYEYRSRRSTHIVEKDGKLWGWMKFEI